MKAKNLFFGALTCLAFAACSNDDEPVVNGAQAEGKNAYVAVQLVMSGNGTSTRAWQDDADSDDYYAQGNAAELAVKDATFFFFDESGNSVQDAQTYTITKKEDGSTNTIDDIYNAIVVIKDKVPASIAAVLNMPDAAKTSLAKASLTNLRQALSSTNNWAGATINNFVMSNSVYVDGGAIRYSTPVTGENIIRTDTELTPGNPAPATAVPVVIPVERILARVSVSYKTKPSPSEDLENGYTDNTLDLYNDGTEDPVTIKPFITGWWLHSTNEDSYLIKDLSTSYTWKKSADNSDATISYTDGWWNDKTDARSYWANAHKVSYNTYRYSSANLADKYCFENTDVDHPTTLMVAAILKTYNSISDQWEAINLIQWMNFNFTSENDCKNYLANYLNANGYSNDGADLVAADLKFVYNNNDNTGLNTYDWQTRVSVNSGVVLKKGTETVANADNTLKDQIGFLKFYNGGQTYYFTKIQHEPLYVETKNAIIRNHLYQISLTGITGLGTPVPNPSDVPSTPDPDDPTPEDPSNPDPEYPDPDKPTPDPTDPDQPIDPETPTNDYSSISAQIKVLEYRIVKQDVNLDNK